MHKYGNHISKKTRAPLQRRRGKTVLADLVARPAFFIVVMGSLLFHAFPGTSPVFAMDTLTEGELGSITAAAGIVMSAGNTAHLDIKFNAIAQSNPSKDGWLIIKSDADGTPSVTGYDPAILAHTITPGEYLILDSATTGGTGFTTNDVDIPANTTFVASSSLPVIQPDVTVPDYMFVGVGSTSGTMAKTFGMAGFKGVNIQAFDVQQGYLWAHE